MKSELSILPKGLIEIGPYSLCSVDKCRLRTIQIHALHTVHPLLGMIITWVNVCDKHSKLLPREN